MVSPMSQVDDPVEQIHTLSATNRAAPNPSTEQRLVMLRHEAFDPDVAPPRTLPEPIRAATDDPGPLRPLAPDELDIDSLRAGLARHGCVHVRGMLDTALVERLVDGIDRALAACDAGLAGAPVSETTPWYAPFTPPPGRYRIGGRRSWIRASGGVWTADSPRMLFELCELIEQMGIGALVEQHLGERPALSANKNTLRRVPVDTNTNWHQDGAFLCQDVRTLNLWIALSPCGTDAPGLDIVPRRFTLAMCPPPSTRSRLIARSPTRSPPA